MSTLSADLFAPDLSRDLTIVPRSTSPWTQSASLPEQHCGSLSTYESGQSPIASEIDSIQGTKNLWPENPYQSLNDLLHLATLSSIYRILQTDK